MSKLEAFDQWTRQHRYLIIQAVVYFGLCVTVASQVQDLGMNILIVGLAVAYEFCGIRYDRKSRVLSFKELWGHIVANYEARGWTGGSTVYNLGKGDKKIEVTVKRVPVPDGDNSDIEEEDKLLQKLP